MRKNCALLLGRTGDFSVVDSLGFVMKDPDVTVRKAAVDALCLQEGRPSSKYLMVALTDEVPMIRIASAYALGRAGTPESTDALMLLLSDPDDAVRVAAAKAIGIQAEDRAADSLIGALSDENGFVVIAAIETLGKMKSSRARDAIAGRLSSADDEIKRTAISALAAFKGMHAYIKPFLRDPDWATRKVAVEALAGERDPSVTRLLEDVYDNEEDLTVKKAIEVVLSAHR
jgi:HEAT repeat protein